MKSFGIDVPASMPQLDELAAPTHAFTAQTVPTTEAPENTTSPGEAAGMIAVAAAFAGLIVANRYFSRRDTNR